MRFAAQESIYKCLHILLKINMKIFCFTEFLLRNMWLTKFLALTEYIFIFVVAIWWGMMVKKVKEGNFTELRVYIPNHSEKTKKKICT